MSNVLSTRLKRLETLSGANDKPSPKVVRIVVNAEEEAEAYRMAEEMGLDTSADSNDILIIRLVGLAPRDQAADQSVFRDIDRLMQPSVNIL